MRDPLLPVVTRALVAVVLIAPVAQIDLTAQSVTQPALKAAFLFNFAKFVEWPADETQHGPLSLCVLDDISVEDSLAQLINGAPFSGRSVTLLRGARIRSLRGCHVLYMGETDQAHIAETLEELKNTPVLTVGDGEPFARGGGMIGLFIEDGRMRFAINPDAALRAGLKLSSRLLNLARIVKEGRHAQS